MIEPAGPSFCWIWNSHGPVMVGLDIEVVAGTTALAADGDDSTSIASSRHAAPAHRPTTSPRGSTLSATTTAASATMAHTFITPNATPGIP
jgi:hypothetical protein